MSLSFIDIFCGAGGSSCGLEAAGLELKLAANHWDVAINTHAKNFPDADHLCADVNNYDMRRLPKADLLWASPICTEISPAGGRRRVNGQLDMLAELPAAAFERTRATAWDVIRATEVWKYAAIMIENVVEFATQWELFDAWLNCMDTLGYNHQIVCVSSAHVGGPDNAHAPQWRDRLYVVFFRKDIAAPDITPRPLAWCFECGDYVEGVQHWRNPKNFRKIGKYRQQYDYVCPNTQVRHQNWIVEPFVRPAASAIDWSDLGTRIGDRKRPLAENTLRRIEAGLQMITEEPQTILVTLNHGGDDGRLMLPTDGPLPTRTIKIGEALVTPMVLPVGGPNHDQPPTWAAGEPMRTRLTRDTDALVTAPFIAELRNHCTASPISDPLTTMAGARHHGVIVPPPDAFYVKNYGGNCEPRHTVKPITDPLGTVTAIDHHALVIPYRKGNQPTTTAQPLPTMSTHDSAALLDYEVNVEDCRMRMLQPREQLAAQRFPARYLMTGTKGEQTMQAGNAVSSNVPQWIGGLVSAALDAR